MSCLIVTYKLIFKDLVVGRGWDKKFEGFDARQTLHVVVRELLRQQIYIML